MNIEQLFGIAFQNIRATWHQPKRKPNKPFIRQAMPFLPNIKGMRWELDTDENSPTFNQAHQVERTHARLVATGEPM